MRSARSHTTPTYAAPRVPFLSAGLPARTPFRPPALIHSGRLHSALTACVCPRLTSCAAHLKAQSDISAAGLDPQKPRPFDLAGLKYYIVRFTPQSPRLVKQAMDHVLNYIELSRPS